MATTQPTQGKPLRILSLDVENILRVVAVHIRPDGRVVELTGKNREGKSSTIDALWMALGGEKMIPDDPIHDDAPEGRILVDVGNDDGIKYRVTRRIKRKEGGGVSTSLIIENEDGAKIQNAQQILNGLIGSLSCDPLEFIAMKPKDQFDLLKKFVPGVDFDAIAEAHDKDFKDRTDTNRDLKALQAQIAAVPTPADDLPAERIDESSLVSALESAGNHNSQIERTRAMRVQAARDIENAATRAKSTRDRAAELREQAADLDDQADRQDRHIAGLKQTLEAESPLADPIDTAAVRVEIESARASNARFDDAARVAKDLEALRTRAATLGKRSDELTKAIDDRNAAKNAAIAAAEMPIEGISFGDGCLMLGGHPLEAGSQAEKLQIAIGIAAALQPRLRFVTTKNGALLDADSWAALVAMAERMDLLIIAETVNSQRPTAVVIEDGHVRGAIRQAAE